MALKWKPGMSVGEENIDNQHKKLIDQINKLIKALNSNQELSAVRDVVRFLGDYVDEHFTYEEKYMENIKFSGIEDHKKIHANFVKFMMEFKDGVDKLDPKSGSLSSELNALAEKAKKFLGDWLINHILTEDQEYVISVKK